MMIPGRAIVLLSGGMDSTTTLAIAKVSGFELYALSFQYGQRHQYELVAAERVAAAIGVAQHRVVSVDLRAFGGSSLTDDLPLPLGRSAEEMREIPSTYVPARNTIFLSLALAWAEVVGARAIFIGVNALDYTGYPDCRPEYLRAFEAMANLALAPRTEQPPLTIQAPLLHLSKQEILKRGLALGVDYSLTSTCYNPGVQGEACGQCDACRLRLDAFAALGITDPIRYRAA